LCLNRSKLVQAVYFADSEFCGVSVKILRCAQDDSGDKAQDDSGDKTQDDSGDKAQDDSGDKAQDDSGDKAQNDSGDKTQDDSGDKTQEDSGDKTQDDSGRSVFKILTSRHSSGEQRIGQEDSDKTAVPSERKAFVVQVSAFRPTGTGIFKCIILLLLAVGKVAGIAETWDDV